MGMFNYVTGSHKTPCCQNSQTGWQSKYGEIKGASGKVYVVESILEKINIKDFYRGEIHTTCDKCDRFIEHKIKNGKLADWTDR